MRGEWEVWILGLYVQASRGQSSMGKRGRASNTVLRSKGYQDHYRMVVGWKGITLCGRACVEILWYNVDLCDSEDKPGSCSSIVRRLEKSVLAYAQDACETEQKAWPFFQSR